METNLKKLWFESDFLNEKYSFVINTSLSNHQLKDFYYTNNMKGTNKSFCEYFKINKDLSGFDLIILEKWR